MSVVSFRIDRKLKDRMSRLRHIRWSELLRLTVERIVTEEEKKLVKSKDREKMKIASREMDRLASLAKGSGWKGEEEILKWRKTRYSLSTRA
jgi:hypothetical protein